MKHKIFVLLTCMSSLLFLSCEKQAKYKSGMYAYQYYLVNGTSSPVSLDGITLENKSWKMNTNDTVLFTESFTQSDADELIYLHRPSLQDGYKGTINEGKYELTYQNKVYKIDESQSNTFTKCINYKGIQSPKSDFIYEYYFVIDEDYIATLPLKK